MKSLNDFLEGKEYLVGNLLTIADISILPSVTSFAVSLAFFFLKMINLNSFETFQELGYNFAEYENVDKWSKKMVTLPGYEENLDGSKNLAETVKGVYENSVV